VLIPRPETEFIVEEALARVTTDARPLDSETTVPPRPRSRKPPLDAARGGPELAEGPAKRVLERRVLQTDAVALVRGAASEAVLSLAQAAAPAGFPESLPIVPVLRIADVGTGSGCLAVALARWLPAAQVVATDMSAAALAIAARNVCRHEVQDRVTLVRCDLLDATSSPFDLIVSNPPYVTESEYATLAPEVRAFEPELALTAGPDGLRDISEIVRLSPAALTPGGTLIVEIGDTQAEAVRQIVAAVPSLRLIEIRADLQGIPRTLVVRRE